MIEMHYPVKGDLPEPSGEMRAQRKPVLAYTKSLGWTQAIRRQVGKKKFEWVCSDYDGNTRFFDDEITAWTELPEPEQEGKDERGYNGSNVKLIKAKELILKLYNAGRDVLMCRTEEKAYDNLSEAINDRSIEQFLKEVEE